MSRRIHLGLARDLRTVVVAVVAASAVSGPAAVAAVYVANADKVDNKHAVGAGATVDSRKGKLVATSPTTGRLPNNIIARAPDADRLDGLDSSDLLPATGKAADADTLDGVDSLGFLLSDGKASDADLLDGKNSTDFLSASGKAVDADRLDGIDSSQLPTRSELAAAGSVNLSSNPVNWSKLKEVPAEIADGDDAGQGTFHGVQFNNSLAANATQTFFTHSWSKNLTVVWQAVPTTPGGRVSSSVVVEDAGSTYTYWVTVRNELGTAVSYEARYTAIPRS